MKLSRLFNVPVKKKSDLIEAKEGTTSVGAFITPQALVSFPVASGLVTGIWKFLAKLNTAWTDSIPLLLLIALVIGLLIWAISLSELKKDMNAGEIIISIIIAILNSLCLAMTALGISYSI